MKKMKNSATMPFPARKDGKPMFNMFSEQSKSDSRDSKLISAAQQGDRSSLEELILRHQAWIYNIALRMVGFPPDAEEVTREILIKVMTKLSTFQGKSSFRTWLYRIMANHVINMKKRTMENLFSSFGQHSSILGDTPDMEIPDKWAAPVDVKLLIEETKMNCMMGMLLCLDRPQRLVFTLGAILHVTASVGGDIMQISAENFRQKLSRARKQLSNYMNEKCGLMNAKNPCRCARKTRASIEAGYVDPYQLKFNSKHVQRVKSIVTEEAHWVEDALDMRAQNLFRDHPFQEPSNNVQILKKILDCKEVQEMIDFKCKA